MNASQRPITSLGWVLGVVFLPAGFFLALATARVISWTKAILWFLLYTGLTICFARGMARLEEINAAKVVIQLFLQLGVGVFTTEGFLIYYYGQTAGYWSEQDRKGWRVLAIVALCQFMLQAFSVLAQIVVIPLWIKG